MDTMTSQPSVITVLIIGYLAQVTIEGSIPAFHHMPGQDLQGGPAQLCPIVDCFHLMPELACDYKDTYISTMTIYGHKCPGCPACREYKYLKEVADDITKQVQEASSKLIMEKNIFKKNRIMLQEIKQQTDGTSYDNGDSVGRESVIQTLESNLFELENLWSDSAIIKAVRYLEENYQELNQLLENNTFLESRLDMNIHGYFERMNNPFRMVYDDIHYSERYRYDEIIQDYSLDKLTQLNQRTDWLQRVLANYTELIDNITSIDEEGYDNMYKDNPLMLRRFFQLLESCQDSLHVYLASDMGGLTQSTDGLNILFKKIRPSVGGDREQSDLGVRDGIGKKADGSQDRYRYKRAVIFSKILKHN